MLLFITRTNNTTGIVTGIGFLPGVVAAAGGRDTAMGGTRRRRHLAALPALLAGTASAIGASSACRRWGGDGPYPRPRPGNLGGRTVVVCGGWCWGSSSGAALAVAVVVVVVVRAPAAATAGHFSCHLGRVEFHEGHDRRSPSRRRRPRFGRRRRRLLPSPVVTVVGHGCDAQWGEERGGEKRGVLTRRRPFGYGAVWKLQNRRKRRAVRARVWPSLTRSLKITRSFSTPLPRSFWSCQRVQLDIVDKEGSGMVTMSAGLPV
mmetsp:Transcript_7006/g.15493  ORF Transcript_7006/g.15493 Transcript_7006/m.15493 type:complete len:262 (-) Transcript_7006:24-809(-)